MAEAEPRWVKFGTAIINRSKSAKGVSRTKYLFQSLLWFLNRQFLYARNALLHLIADILQEAFPLRSESAIIFQRIPDTAIHRSHLFIRQQAILIHQPGPDGEILAGGGVVALHIVSLP